MRIGVRAHDFGKWPADELAARIAAQGMTCVQLALSKAIAGLDLQPGCLNPGLAFHIGQAFRRHNIQIAVLGCYINPIHPELKTRQTLLSLFKEHLRFARDFGCGLVGLETGSLHADYSPHPDNSGAETFRMLLDSLGELVEEAEHFGVLVAIEGVTGHVVSSPACMRRVLDAIQSNNLQVIFDPVNLLSLENHRDQDRIIQESFDLFGERIVIIHAKDFIVQDQTFRAVRTGQGQLNHKRLLELINQHKPCISILLEEASEETAAACAQFLNSLAQVD
jgi:sugar phosphate isomerase/epimerase